MKRKGKFVLVAKLIISTGLVAVAGFCISARVPQCFDLGSAAVFTAAAVALGDGEYITEEIPAPKESAKYEEPTQPATQAQSVTVSRAEEQTQRDKSGYYDSFSDHSGAEKYTVTEKTIAADGTRVDKSFVKNKTGLEVDFDSLLNSELTFDIEGGDKYEVLIYHTHTCESYLDEDVDFFYNDFYPRTQNTDFSVVAVGEAVAKALNENGIKTLHDKTVHDSVYKGAYERSVQTVLGDMEENDGIKVVLDIHRDALGTEKNKVKPVFEYNGKKGAQIMILSGCDPNGARGFEGWRSNLNFALKLQNTAEALYPGMTRPLDFDCFVYNEYVCDGSLLIEVGADANSIDEAVYSGELLGDVIARVLNG